MAYLRAQYSITVLRIVWMTWQDWWETVACCMQMYRGWRKSQNLGASCALLWAAKILTAFVKEIHYLVINSESELPQGLNACKNNNNSNKERNESLQNTSALYIRLPSCRGLEFNKAPAKFLIWLDCVDFGAHQLCVLASSVLCYTKWDIKM
jgi:hypothetical protein